MAQTKNVFLSKKIIEFYNSINFNNFKDTEIALINVLNSAENEYDKLIDAEQKLVENIIELKYSKQEIIEMFKTLVIWGCFRGIENNPGRNYEIAKKALKDKIGLDYETEVDDLIEPFYEKSFAERCSEEFFDINKNIKHYADNENYRKNVDEHSYEVGKKLWLEIQVVDKKMSHYLFKWMYSTFEKEREIPFGCELNEISFSPPGNEKMRKKLNEFLIENFGQ